MDLSPREIAQKQFSVALRGYEKSEVEAYLTWLVQEVEQALAAARAPSTATPGFEALGREVASVLTSARQAADALRARAKEETDALRKEASETAARIREDARQKAETLRASSQDEARQVTQKARADADATRRAAEEAASEMRRKAQADSERIRADAERRKSQLLDEAEKRHAALVAHERDVRSRLEGTARALEQLKDLVSTEAPAPKAGLVGATVEAQRQPAPESRALPEARLEPDTRSAGEDSRPEPEPFPPEPEPFRPAPEARPEPEPFRPPSLVESWRANRAAATPRVVTRAESDLVAEHDEAGDRPGREADPPRADPDRDEEADRGEGEEMPVASLSETDFPEEGAPDLEVPDPGAPRAAGEPSPREAPSEPRRF
ncbi:MAG: DivIVA domain-containing protein [Actinomycetota bacterium]